MVVWVKTDDLHAMLIDAALEIILPARLGGIEGANGQKQVWTVLLAFGGQALVHCGKIAMKDTVKTARPGLTYTVLPESLGELLRCIIW